MTTPILDKRSKAFSVNSIGTKPAPSTINPTRIQKPWAEKEAWQIANAQNRWQLAVINPGFVLGPSLTKRVDSTSISVVLDFLKGKLAIGVPDLCFGVVDVRNVAEAHLAAAFKQAAEGRFILVAEQRSLLGIAHAIADNYPNKYRCLNG